MEETIKYIDPEILKDGKVLLYLKNDFLQNRCTETLIPLLGCLRDSHVIVPMNLIMSNEDRERLKNAKVGDTFSNKEDIRLRPDILQNGEDFFFPVFSNEEEMPKDYAAKFSPVSLPVVQCIAMAKSNEHICGLVLDAFTAPVVLKYDVADIIPQLESRFKPEETAREQ